MARIVDGYKPLAALSKTLAKSVQGSLGVTDAAIRDWRVRKGAEEGSKVGRFAKAFGLTRAHLVGDAPLTEEWWAEFKAKHGAENSLKSQLMAAASKLDEHNITPETRAAALVVIEAVKSSVQPATKAELPPAKRKAG